MLNTCGPPHSPLILTHRRLPHSTQPRASTFTTRTTRTPCPRHRSPVCEPARCGGCTFPGRPHQRGVRKRHHDEGVELVVHGALDSPHGRGRAGQRAHGQLAHRQAGPQHRQRGTRPAAAQRVDLRDLLVEQVGHLEAASGPGVAAGGASASAKLLAAAALVLAGDLLGSAVWPRARAPSRALGRRCQWARRCRLLGGRCWLRGTAGRTFMSVMGMSEAISSMSSRLRSGRGSKNTGWKPSSVCTRLALLLSTSSSSSPVPCQAPAGRHTCPTNALRAQQTPTPACHQAEPSPTCTSRHAAPR
jgi:hypothetical protein